MSAMDWRRGRWALLLLVLGGTLGSTWCVGSAAARARVSVSKARVVSPGLVTVRGSGWVCGAGVRLEAFVVGISPYGLRRLGTLGTKRGRFSKRWRTPLVSDSLPWAVQAAQR